MSFASFKTKSGANQLPSWNADLLISCYSRSQLPHRKHAKEISDDESGAAMVYRVLRASRKSSCRKRRHDSSVARRRSTVGSISKHAYQQSSFEEDGQHSTKMSGGRGEEEQSQDRNA